MNTAAVTPRVNSAAIARNASVTRNTTAFNRSTMANRNAASLNRANRYGGRWYAANAHPGWNPARAYFWNRHHYRWYDGGWLIVDDGFWPFDYAYPYDYGYPTDYDNTDEPAAVGSYDNSAALDVQTELANQGYYYGPIDGDIGPMSRQAIMNYQHDHNLPLSGAIDEPLLQSLGLN